MNIEDLHINFHHEDHEINAMFFDLVYSIHSAATIEPIRITAELALDMIGDLISHAEDLTIETEIKKLQQTALQAVYPYSKALDTYNENKHEWHILVAEMQKSLKIK